MTDTYASLVTRITERRKAGRIGTREMEDDVDTAVALLVEARADVRSLRDLGDTCIDESYPYLPQNRAAQWSELLTATAHYEQEQV